MKKHLTKTRILFYMLLVAIAGMVVLPATYARYRTQVQGNGTASIAAWGSASAISKITIDVSSLEPGTSMDYKFEIKNENEKGGGVSDTAQEYSILVETTGNLPLKFTLSSIGDAPQGSSFVTKVGDMTVVDGKAEATGGFLPHTVSVTHQYELRVSWPGDAADADYADEIDAVTLTVDAVQASPENS